jgi:thiol-disulfide isomerase/thioredoxin
MSIRNALWVFGLLLVVGLGGALSSDVAAKGKYFGKEFPNFTARDPISGDRFSLDDFRGKVVLIDFWATWCGPCVRELPNVRRVYEKHKDDGLIIISISLDFDRSRFRTFVRRNDMPWHHVMEGGGWDTRLAKKYGIRSIPSMFVLDHDGVVIADSAHGEELEKVIAGALEAMPDEAIADGPAAGDERSAPRRERSSEPGLTADEVDAVQQGLDHAAGALRRAASPLESLRTTVQDAERTIADLREDLLAIGRSGSAREQYERMHDQLAEARLELFVCGYFEGEIIALPASPFDGGDVDERRAAVSAVATFPAVQDAAKALEAVLDRALSDIDRVRRGIDGLGQSLKHDNPSTTLRSRADRLIAEADELAERCRRPWTDHLMDADAVLGSVTSADSAIVARIDTTASEIEVMRGRVGAACRDREALQTFNADCAKLIDEFNAIVSSLEAEDLIDEGAIKPLTNPLATAIRSDTRTRIETELELDRAAEAAKSMRAAASRSQGEVDELASRLADLQRELEQADEQQFADIKDRFREFCRRLLASIDEAAASRG